MASLHDWQAGRKCWPLWGQIAEDLIHLTMPDRWCVHTCVLLFEGWIGQSKPVPDSQWGVQPFGEHLLRCQPNGKCSSQIWPTPDGRQGRIPSLPFEVQLPCAEVQTGANWVEVLIVDQAHDWTSEVFNPIIEQFGGQLLHILQWC